MNEPYLMLGIKLRPNTSRLIVGLVSFAAIAVAGFWLAYQVPYVQTLGLPPCASPPDYEMVSVPCADPDLSMFSSLPGPLRFLWPVTTCDSASFSTLRVRIPADGTENDESTAD